MSTNLLLIIIIILLLGGGGGYYFGPWKPSKGPNHLVAVVISVVIAFMLLRLLGIV